MIDIKRGRYVDSIAVAWLDKVNHFFNDPSKPWIERKGRRVKFSSYKNRLKFQCLAIVSEYTTDARLRKVCIAQLQCWWRHFDDIILASPASMAAQVKKWQKRKDGKYRLLEALKPVLIWYYDTVSDRIGHELVESLNIKTCPYCNRQFIYTFKGKTPDMKDRPERPELDHFYPKNTYPLYCLSFYNLIPACHSCNHVKSESLIGVNPYSRAFGSKFVITDKKGKNVSPSKIYKLTQKEIGLKLEGKNAEEEANSRVLGLENVYNKHTDFVKELIDKTMAYDAHARKALVESFQGAGLHPRQVYDFVWGRHLMDADYEDRPLSKLTKDMLDLLGIRRG